jgi:hypothetical protein
MSDDIFNAQERLEQMMNRAQSGEDREMARWVRESGEQLVRGLLGLIRMSRFHHPDNDAFEKPSLAVSNVLAEVISRLGVAALVFVEDQVYLNDIRVRYETRLDLGREMSEFFAAFNVGGVTFHQPMDGIQMGELVKYFGSYVGNRPTLLRELAEMGYTHIELPGVHRFLKPGETQREKKDATVREVQAVAQSAVSRIMLQATQDRLVDLLSMRKVANKLVDAHTNELIELETADSANSTFTAHCLNVAQIAVGIGKTIGLDENQQADLAVCALTHDLGYGMREDGYATPFERHESAGMRSLIKRRGFHESHIRRMLATVDHHTPHSTKGDFRPSLYARVIHIAEDYDNLTRFRSGAPHLSPTQAVAKMASGGGKEYDPTILAAMINLVGKYPPGTPLQLSDGRFGSSVSFVRTPESFAKPLVRIIGIEGDRAVPLDETIDLALSKVTVIRPLDSMGVVYG